MRGPSRSSFAADVPLAASTPAPSAFHEHLRREHEQHLRRQQQQQQQQQPPPPPAVLVVKSAEDLPLLFEPPPNTIVGVYIVDYALFGALGGFNARPRAARAPHDGHRVLVRGFRRELSCNSPHVGVHRSYRAPVDWAPRSAKKTARRADAVQSAAPGSPDQRAQERSSRGAGTSGDHTPSRFGGDQTPSRFGGDQTPSRFLDERTPRVRCLVANAVEDPRCVCNGTLAFVTAEDLLPLMRRFAWDLVPVPREDLLSFATCRRVSIASSDSCGYDGEPVDPAAVRAFVLSAPLNGPFHLHRYFDTAEASQAAYIAALRSRFYRLDTDEDTTCFGRMIDSTTFVPCARGAVRLPRSRAVRATGCLRAWLPNSARDPPLTIPLRVLVDSFSGWGR
jgi:hypothetical protein